MGSCVGVERVTGNVGWSGRDREGTGFVKMVKSSLLNKAPWEVLS